MESRSGSCRTYFRGQADQDFESGAKRAGERARYQVDQTQGGPRDRWRHRPGEPTDAQYITAGPCRITVGELMRVGQRVDRPGSVRAVGQGQRDGIVDAE